MGCDAGCRAFDINGVITTNVFVAGDIARAPHVLYDYQFLAMEHWDNAVLGARVAAHNMVCDDVDRWAHLLIPQFWSGQFGVNVKSVGVPSFGDEIVFTQGSVKQRRFAAAYGRRGRIVGAVTFSTTGSGSSTTGRRSRGRDRFRRSRRVLISPKTCG